VLFADLSCCLIFILVRLILASLCPHEEASLCEAEMVANKISMKNLDLDEETW